MFYAERLHLSTPWSRYDVVYIEGLAQDCSIFIANGGYYTILPSNVTNDAVETFDCL